MAPAPPSLTLKLLQHFYQINKISEKHKITGGRPNKAAYTAAISAWAAAEGKVNFEMTIECMFPNFPEGIPEAALGRKNANAVVVPTVPGSSVAAQRQPRRKRKNAFTRLCSSADPNSFELYQEPGGVRDVHELSDASKLVVPDLWKETKEQAQKVEEVLVETRKGMPGGDFRSDEYVFFTWMVQDLAHKLLKSTNGNRKKRGKNIMRPEDLCKVIGGMLVCNTSTKSNDDVWENDIRLKVDKRDLLRFDDFIDMIHTLTLVVDFAEAGGWMEGNKRDQVYREPVNEFNKKAARFGRILK